VVTWKLCLLPLLAFVLAAQPVVDTTRSPHAALRPLPIRSVRLADGFWSKRMRVNAEKSLPSLLALLEQHGVVDNFRRLSGRKNVPRRGPLYTDSDLYKWMEAAAFVLQSEDRADLRKALEKVIDDVVAAQEPDGYLNTYYAAERKQERHTNMRHGHELYCLGHLLQAGIAYHRAGGGRKLLDAGIRMADYVLERFGPGKRPILEGHPEIELALVELYRTTGSRKYLDFAGYLLQGDPRIELAPRDLSYLFTGKPFTSRTHLEGHAVRAMYAASGATDYYMETGDPAYRKTLETLWRDLTQTKMYISGGVGSRASGEAFGAPYELPNETAYAESCGAIGNMIWNWRMLLATGEARFADLLEQVLYNAVNAGMSLSGTTYCYRTPLALRGDRESTIRNPWYETTCCPPNLQRILASLPGYFYSESAEGLWVHLYHSGRLQWNDTVVTQTTGYPWDGDVELRIEPPDRKEFTLFVRIPAWAGPAKVEINKERALEGAPGRYLAIRRVWKKGDRVRLTFDMTPRMMMANPRVRENAGKAAVMRGPLLYCIEGLDQQGVDSIYDVTLVGLNRFRPERRADLLGGVVVLKHLGGMFVRSTAADPLYQPWIKRSTRRAELTLIPYYTFANREPTAMQVWIPVE